jgi:hypothetical protein
MRYSPPSGHSIPRAAELRPKGAGILIRGVTVPDSPGLKPLRAEVSGFRRRVA